MSIGETDQSDYELQDTTIWYQQTRNRKNEETHTDTYFACNNTLFFTFSIPISMILFNFQKFV